VDPARWRMNAPHLVTLVRAGPTLTGGMLAEWPCGMRSGGANALVYRICYSSGVDDWDI
jgi:hypothetical protein